MARRKGGDFARPPQVIRPRDGASSPIAARSNVVLPEPFGPIRMVGAPALNVSVTQSRIATLRARIETSSNTIGRSVSGARIGLIPRSVRRRGARPRPVR